MQSVKPTNQTQQPSNPDPNTLNPSPADPPTSNPNPGDMSKVISELVIQNTSYLHRINESVVNRLLNIIETNQQVMANSRCSHAYTC
jgi:hypothetical protein